MSVENNDPVSANEFVKKDKNNEDQAKIKELEELNKSLNEKVTELTEERDKFKDISLRSRAELDNTIRRNKIDVDKARLYGSQKLLEELIPAIDSLELGLANSQDVESDKSHADGMNMILDMLLKTLEKHGVEQINPLGKEFNPEYHEAMTLQPTKDFKPNSIISVLQKGYLLKERLIRPARVIVAKELA